MWLKNILIRLHLWYAGRKWTRLSLVLANLHPAVVSLSQTNGIWVLETTDTKFHLSDASQFVRIVGFGIDMRNRVVEKYSNPGFVEVEQNDIVVDVGAFIGEFSKNVADKARKLIAIEPDDRNVEALRRNLAQYQNTTVINRAVWNKSGPLEFNVAGDPSEGSLIDVDESGVSQTVSIEAISISDLADKLDLETVDFLKVEAEGTEPEVLEGIGNIQVRKLAVECSPERRGKSPADEVRSLLSEQNYEIEQREHIIFARKNY